MTREELEEQIERAVGGFSALDGVEDDVAEALVGEGFLSYGSALAEDDRADALGPSSVLAGYSDVSGATVSVADQEPDS